MMDQPTGRFVPLPKEAAEKILIVDDIEQQKHILAALPKPTLYIGEVIEIKGVKFEVIRIKADGKLGLKMLATYRTPSPSPAPDGQGERNDNRLEK